jgi:D-sedoheptulose 7-phosphate isomerase
MRAIVPVLGHTDSGSVFVDAYLRSYIQDLHATLCEIDGGALLAVARVLLRARREQRQILIIGNGGSAATASHLACDLGKGTVDYSSPGFTRFRAVSLADNTALMTALGNDLAFDEVFAEQLATVMVDGDVVIVISASGSSPNLVRAIEYARTRGAETIGLLGFGGGRLATLVDHALVVTSRNYGIAEDFHVIVQHVLTQYLRRALSGPARPVAFLDRDGVINRRARRHEYISSWHEFRFNDGAIPLLRGLADNGFELVVVTNQQGVGKGRVSRVALEEMHDEMSAALSREGVRLTRVLCCPHLELDQCACRKPRPGLIHRAMNEIPFLIDLAASVMIGDSPSDMLAGRAAGVGRLIFIGERNAALPDGTIVAGSVRDVLTLIPRALAALRS